ncbi:MAG: choice-of-anchor D domain-containing protein [Ignavibacteria bacterium]|nr:choice-of-anchor D domain-containing protein [Ignavibacteria bacterium]MBK9182511.1 choice-of-anchor D domain-containing protein [Ignavibacteria bacterium]
MIRSLFLVGLVTFAAVCAYAQPAAEVYCNPFDRADTIMDFGVTLEGSPTTRTFVVENTGATTIGILETNPQADPYYLIINVPGVPPEDPRKEEFERVERLPYYIPAGAKRTFSVIYRAIAGNPLFPPDRVVEALLKLRVVDSLDPLGASLDKTFRLRALKTTSILGSTTPWIAYDSVYVNPQPLAPTQPYTVDNAISRRVNVDRQILEMQTTLVGPPEIEVDTFMNVQFGPEDSVVWTTRYRPYNRGLDSAHFLVVYRPDITAKPDTITGVISGIGVEQRLTLVGAIGLEFPVVVRGDTVDFGAIPTDGQGVSAKIIVRNDGNLNIGILSESKVGIQRDTAAFIVTKPLADAGPTLRTGAFDTLNVTFVPTDGGDHRIRFVVGTDLLQRGIDGVPDGAQLTQWHFKGFGQRPQIQVTPGEIDFGTVVLLETCTSTVERTFTVRNVGNAELRVDSIRISPSTARITVNPQTFRLAPGESQSVRCIYEPEADGTFRGSITLFTNSLIRSYDVLYTAVVVRPDSIRVGVPPITTARPGSTAGIAVLATPERVRTTDRCVLTMNFNPNLLRYRGVLQTGTASEGAQVVDATEQPRGSLRLALQAPANFLERPELVTILFDTFLGESASTDVSFSTGSTTFGNAGCSSVLTVEAVSGQFMLDSLCGLSYKTVVSGVRLLAGVFPNPASDHTTVTFVVKDRRTVSVVLVDPFGRVYDVLSPSDYDPGVHTIPMPVGHLPVSSYTLIVRSGTVFFSVPLVVGR